MNEIAQLVVEMTAGTVTLLLGALSQRRAARRSREQAVEWDGSASLEAIGVQLDALDAMIEAETEPAVRVRRQDDENSAAMRAIFRDIDDLAALAEPPAAGAYEEPLVLGSPATVLAGEELFGLASSPGERARVFLSTGETLDASGASFAFLVVGNRGRQRITVSSGASQSSIVAAIDQFTDATGVYALQDAVNPDLIRFVSVRRGPSHYVGAGLVQGRTHNAFFDENRANPADRQLDFGA